MPPKRRPASPDGPASTGPGSTRSPARTASRASDYRIESLAKGLRVLSLFTEQRPTWRVTDIAETVGMPLPTVYRIVMTLSEEGYLEHLPDGDYRPDIRALTLGSSALRSLDLVQLATPRLQALAASTGETVNLAVLNDDRVLYLVRLRNSDLVTANIQVGSTLPAAHTSIGKLLLAHLDEAELASRVGATSFSPHAGPNALTSVSELSQELARVREQGWAVQDQELAYGLRSVAAPVFDATGLAVAGANVAVQSRDWTRERILDELQPAVVEVCREISGLLGHRGDVA